MGLLEAQEVVPAGQVQGVANFRAMSQNLACKQRLNVPCGPGEISRELHVCNWQGPWPLNTVSLTMWCTPAAMLFLMWW